MEAGEYGLTRVTWFFARRLQVVAIVGLMWVGRRVFGGADFPGGGFRLFFSSSNAHGILQV